MTKPWTQLVPTEAFEQEQFVQWLSSQDYEFCALSPDPNTTPARRAKRARMGLRAGWPDLLVVLKRGALMAIELKRISGGKTSSEQKKVLAQLNRAGILSLVARGAEEAKNAVLEAEKH